VFPDCEHVERVQPPPPGSDTVAPLFLRTSMLRTVFAVGPRRTAVTARAKKGSAFRYTLSEAATVTIGFARRSAGRRSGKRCVKPRRSLRHAKRCGRRVRAGKLTRKAPTGASVVAFSGRIGRKALPPGRYTAALTARDAAGNSSKPKTLGFRIVRR
jgi:hypothetical protein